MQIFLDVLLDSAKDTATLLPFLYITYVCLEAIEAHASTWSEKFIKSAGHAGPAIGAALGGIPQCGFSAMAATLFSARVVTLGTLIAVILATSDEMLPVFLATGAPISSIVTLIGTKVLIGAACGFIIDAIIRVFRVPLDKALRISKMCERDHCGCEDIPGHEHHHHNSIWVAALIHTLQIAIFIFIITFIVGFVMELFGKEQVAAFMAQHSRASVIYAALVGMIPNCAASVLISELFMDGVIGSGAMLAGLLISGGVGLLVLFRDNRPLRQNFAILTLLFVISVFFGLMTDALGIAF